MGAGIAGCGGSGHKVISVLAFPSLPAGQAHPSALGAVFRDQSSLLSALCCVHRLISSSLLISGEAMSPE